MSPLGSARERPLGIYMVLLVVAAAFLALATFATLRELQSDYDFWGSGGYEEDYDEDVEADVEPDADEPIE